MRSLGQYPAVATLQGLLKGLAGDGIDTIEMPELLQVLEHFVQDAGTLERLKRAVGGQRADEVKT